MRISPGNWVHNSKLWNLFQKNLALSKRVRDEYAHPNEYVCIYMQIGRREIGWMHGKVDDW